MLKIISSQTYKPHVLNNVKISLSTLENKIFDFIMNAIHNSGHAIEVRVAGGWVRDKLLPLVRPDIPVNPPKDIDITITGMSGINFVNILEEYAQKTFGFNQKDVRKLNVDFQTNDEQVKAIAAGQISIFGQPIDVVSLRKEIWIDPETGEKLLRNPIVTKGDPVDDAMRRDLTINSMFYNINHRAVEDYTGGFDDLASMTLKPPTRPKPHSISEDEWLYLESKRIFSDDPIRLLRVLRFFSRYEPSKIPLQVLQAMADDHVQRLLTAKIADPTAKGIVVEKISQEFLKIMEGTKPHKAIEIMFQTDILDNILNLPENFLDLDMDQQNSYHDLNLITHIIETIRNVNTLSKQFGLSNEERCLLNISALFHDIGKLDPRTHKIKPSGERGYSGNTELPKDERRTHEQSGLEVWQQFSKSLKLPNKYIRFVSTIIQEHMSPHHHIRQDWRSKKMQDIRKFKDENPLWKYIYIHALADVMSKGQDRSSEIQQYIDNINLIQNIDIPVLLDGVEIQQIFNLKPGPIIGEIMRAIRKAQYNNFGYENEIPIEKQKELAIEVAKDYLRNTLPHLLTRQQVQKLVGIPPSRPPEGMPGYIQFVRNRIKEEQLKNPQLSEAEAEKIVKDMIERGELDSYFNQHHKPSI